jgi:HPt (histidine-containing phosphotransfer) domain-containing protein
LAGVAAQGRPSFGAAVSRLHRLCRITPTLSIHTRMSHDPHPASAARPQLVLDAAALDGLRALDPHGGDGIMIRVLTAFEKSLVAMMAQLRLQLEPGSQGNSEAVFRIAHTLKAPAASCGAPLLARIAREVEQRHRPGASPNGPTSDELRADVTRLTAEGDVVLVAVRAMLRY